MIKKATVMWLCLLISFNTLKAQDPAIIQYINTYKYLAIREMQRSGVPASIKLAQGILETQAGEGDLVKRSYNHFGIKCKTGWDGKKTFHDDDEKGECFRVYASAEDSYRDHSDFLKRSQRYAFLFQLEPTDYKDWAKGLKKAGYATNPKYPQLLIKYIETYDLQFFTLVALGKKRIEEEPRMFAVNGEQTTDIAAMSSVNQQTEEQQPEVKALRMRYPEEAFRINDTRVVVGLEGNSLLAMAEQYQLKYRHLLDFNELSETEDILQKDQLIFLQRKRRQGANPFHVVRGGETLHEIAQEEGIRLDHLLAYNQLKGSEKPVAGEKLYLKKEAAERAIDEEKNVVVEPAQTQQAIAQSLAGTSHSMRLVKHVVQQKETLFSISRKYEVAVDQIRSWNGLDNDSIRSGQELLIYKN